MRDLRYILSYFLVKETNIKYIVKLLRYFSASWILALKEGIRVLAEVKWFIITYFKITIYNFAWEVVSFLYFKMTHIFFLIWISGLFRQKFRDTHGKPNSIMLYNIKNRINAIKCHDGLWMSNRNISKKNWIQTIC